MPRARWLDAETARTQPPARYDDRVVAVFVHHTDSPNGYDCADAPRIIRYLYAGQTGARHWDDIGYNFLVDRCGTIYEGRAGGVDRAVTGAHTQGFNHRTAGIAAIGTFTAGTPVPQAMTEAIAAVAAWKLGLVGHRSAGYRSGSSPATASVVTRPGPRAVLPTLAGHNDGYMTSCPGRRADGPSAGDPGTGGAAAGPVTLESGDPLILPGLRPGPRPAHGPLPHAPVHGPRAASPHGHRTYPRPELGHSRGLSGA